MGDTSSKLHISYGDWTIGVSGERFRYIFSYQRGGPESIFMDGKEWLYRTPKPAFWRALTDNDRGNGFPLRSGMWLAADCFIRDKGVSVKVDGEDIPLPVAPENNRFTEHEYAEEIEIVFGYETITVPAAKTEVAYKITQDGSMHIRALYFGRPGLPELPVFGMRFVMPTVAEGFTYEGLSGETYPDRRAGGVHGVYAVEGLPVVPHLVPQDCGMHMGTKWLEIRRRTELDNTVKEWKETVFRVECEDFPFAFSCLPYTAEELENATHREELPTPRRTVLCVYGAVRGVGGIDSWGAEPEEAYRIPGEKELSVSFVVSPGRR